MKITLLGKTMKGNNHEENEDDKSIIVISVSK